MKPIETDEDGTTGKSRKFRDITNGRQQASNVNCTYSAVFGHCLPVSRYGFS